MKAKARVLRKNQTDAESLLWYYLRDRRLSGHKFRRQHPIGAFIVDFVCTERRLVVELDGGQHALQVEEDSERSAYLKSKGYRVVRFWDHDVLKNTQTVLEVISKITEESDTPSPRPSPPHARERGATEPAGSSVGKDQYQEKGSQLSDRVWGEFLKEH